MGGTKRFAEPRLGIDAVMSVMSAAVQFARLGKYRLWGPKTMKGFKKLLNR